MRNKIKKVLQRYGELNSNLASEHLVERLTDDLIKAIQHDKRDLRPDIDTAVSAEMNWNG